MSVVSARAARVVVARDACPLCAAKDATSSVPVLPRHRDDLLPWAITLTAAVVAAAVGLGPERWIGIGATVGLAAGAACAWWSVRSARRGSVAAHARELQALAEDADGRVEMVIKQFEWAVNDAVRLKREIERAEAAADALMDRARERERYVQRLERQLFETRDRLANLVEAAPAPEPVETVVAQDNAHVPFRWALHLDGGKAFLELENGVSVHRPTRVRIVDRDGQVVAVSGIPEPLASEAFGFVIESPPVDLVADLDAGREPNYAIEALTQYEWLPTRLEDSGRRTRIVTDKQGRLYRVADAADSAQASAAHVQTPSTLN